MHSTHTPLETVCDIQSDMEMTESIGPIIQKIQQSQAVLSIVSAKRHLLLDAFYLSLKSILKTPGLEPNIRAIATTQIPFFYETSCFTKCRQYGCPSMW